MEIDFRTITSDEKNYLYSQGSELDMKCGCIGHLRGDFDSDGESFFTIWFDHVDKLKTDDFKEELDDVINTLRKDGGVLSNRSDMASYCYKHSDGSFNNSIHGFRADTENYTYFIRCSPQAGDYNFYVYCYKREWLELQMNKAKQEIRFIDSHYRELFRIPDGGSITVTYENGETHTSKCRYLDEYHTEIDGRCYHICQFAEIMERNGYAYEPSIYPLPEVCYSTLPSTGELIIINRGESGYKQTGPQMGSTEGGQLLADKLNRKLGVTKAQEAAMLAGSMFGWGTPAADPSCYDKNGNPRPPKKKEHAR